MFLLSMQVEQMRGSLHTPPSNIPYVCDKVSSCQACVLPTVGRAVGRRARETSKASLMLPHPQGRVGRQARNHIVTKPMLMQELRTPNGKIVLSMLKHDLPNLVNNLWGMDGLVKQFQLDCQQQSLHFQNNAKKSLYPDCAVANRHAQRWAA